MPVPDTDTFTMQNVQSTLGLPSNTNLVQCVSTANSQGGWDDYYSGSKNSLLNFRNYGAPGACQEYTIGGYDQGQTEYINCSGVPEYATYDGQGSGGYDQTSFCATSIVNVVYGNGPVLNGPCQTTTTQYFVFQNFVSRAGHWVTSVDARNIIDGYAYKLYEKPSAANNGLAGLPLLHTYAGDPYYSSVYSHYLVYGNSSWLTNVAAVTDGFGSTTYTVTNSNGSAPFGLRNSQFYINILQTM